MTDDEFGKLNRQVSTMWAAERAKVEQMGFHDLNALAMAVNARAKDIGVQGDYVLNTAFRFALLLIHEEMKTRDEAKEEPGQ